MTDATHPVTVFPLPLRFSAVRTPRHLYANRPVSLVSLLRGNIRDNPRIYWRFFTLPKRNRRVVLPLAKAVGNRINRGLLPLLPLGATVKGAWGQISRPRILKIVLVIAFQDSVIESKVAWTNLERPQEAG